MIRPESDFVKSVADLANFIGVNSELNLEFSGLSSDSRSVQAGDLFVALPGSTSHGASYIDAVKVSGAVGVITDEAGAEIVGAKLPVIIISNPRQFLGAICSWFYGSPSSAMQLVGITGTNGKTTTTSILNQILVSAGKSTGLIGTVGIEIGPEKLNANFTTPEASELQSLLATMRERHISHVAMEVSSHALEARRVAGVKFSMVGFTNLTQDHLDFHGDMANYFAAKSKLFTSEYSELGFINIDDPYGQKLFNDSQIPMISLARENTEAQWHFTRIEPTNRGYSVAIRGTGGILIEGEINLIGEHNLDNLLMATAMASQLEIDPIVIGNSFLHLHGAPGRLESVDIGQKFLALVDYAHTPDAVTRILATLRKSVNGRIIAVLGCGGDRDRTKRPIMGRELLAGSDLAIFTSDNPRSESPESILNEMVAGLDLKENSTTLIDRREAIAFAVASALPGDCVIVLGKGHETGQEIAGAKFAFDDRIELARAIEELA
jgi:UDP-N-acetylmuramoyl-L-alanyl-D-glutamate--2,6-diaminopimelate ligase